MANPLEIFKKIWDESFDNNSEKKDSTLDADFIKNLGITIPADAIVELMALHDKKAEKMGLAEIIPPDKHDREPFLTVFLLNANGTLIEIFSIDDPEIPAYEYIGSGEKDRMKMVNKVREKLGLKPLEITKEEDKNGNK